MAKTTKAKTPAKPKTKEVDVEQIMSQVEDLRQDVKEEDTVKTVKASKPEKKKRVFNEHDLINCVNVFAGSTYLTGRRSGIVYCWEDMGVDAYVEYADLRPEAISRDSVYIREPLIVIQDEDFLDEFPKLRELYKNLIGLDELEAVLVSGNEQLLRQTLRNIPKGLKETAKNLVATLIQDGEFDSLKSLNVLDEYFGTEFSKQIGLFL